VLDSTQAATSKTCPTDCRSVICETRVYRSRGHCIYKLLVAYCFIVACYLTLNQHIIPLYHYK